MKYILFLVASFCVVLVATGQPRGYVCRRAAGDITIDGLAAEPSWARAAWTEPFVDISTDVVPRFKTAAKMLWDDRYLYIYSLMEEPHVRAEIAQRDAVVFHDNDFEVFIDPRGEGHDYFEIEINARGTVFDLSLSAPYRTPRRPFVQFQWNCPGLRLATHIDGTLNDPSDVDAGWSVEMAIPREAIASEFENYLRAGSYLRVNFSRVEWALDKRPPEDNWVWSPTGRVAMHMPEKWGYVWLADGSGSSGDEPFQYPADEPVRRLLWSLFYAQQEHFSATGRYLSDLKPSLAERALLPPGVEIVVETTAHTYEITARAPDGRNLVIDEQGRIFPRSEPRVPLYVWQSWGRDTSEESLRRDFLEWRGHGVTGVCLNAGFDVARTAVAARLAHSLGLEYHAWAPCMLQQGLDPSWYAVDRLGRSSLTHPAYVGYYKFLDPHNPHVQEWLIEKYLALAAIPEVDYVQLDYIRYADVILARGLWDKYGLVMHNEYPAADYCYCDECVAAFLERTGIDIRAVEDPSECPEWAQFRCDVLTSFVNRLAAEVHLRGKKVSADVFPGPSLARKMVRQEWNRWDVDALFPMNYNDFYLEPAAWVGTVTREEVLSIASGRVAGAAGGGPIPVYSGLFICRDWRDKARVTDPEGSGLTPTELAEAASLSVAAGASGLCLFTPDRMTDEHWAALHKTLK